MSVSILRIVYIDPIMCSMLETLTCNSLEGLFVHIHDIAVRTAPSGIMLSGRRHFTRRELTDAALK